MSDFRQRLEKEGLEAMVTRLERVAAALEKTAEVQIRLSSQQGQIMSVDGGIGMIEEAESDVKHATQVKYEEILEATGKDAVESAKKVDGKLAEMTEEFLSALSKSGEILGYSFKCKKPSDADFQKLLEPMVSIGKSLNSKTDNRGKFYHNEKFLTEVIGAAMFVITPAPGSHIAACVESGDFQGNKVLMKKIDVERQWLLSIKKVLNSIKGFCEEEIKQGLIWNGKSEKTVFDVINGTNTMTNESSTSSTQSISNGGPSGSGGKGSKGPAAPSAGKGGSKGPAPPPPSSSGSKGGGSSAPQTSSSEGKKGKGAKSAPGPSMTDVFKELEGGNPAAKLRKVQDHEKTKNWTEEERAKKMNFEPKAREGTNTKAVAGGGGGGGGGGGAASYQSAINKKKGDPKGEPKMAVIRDNWMIENWANGGIVEVEDVNMGQIAYICNSNNTTFRIHKKIKSVLIDNCSKVILQVDDVLSTVEIVNSEKITVHAIGSLNTIQIDKTDTFCGYLSEKSEGCRIVHALSINLNIAIKDGDEYKEIPIPSQFVCTLNKKRTGVDTIVSDIYE